MGRIANGNKRRRTRIGERLEERPSNLQKIPVERRSILQKKTDKFLDKIVKKDYNNELEKVLEKKAFDENTKSLLLNILYKIETAYQDYEKVKPEVEEKEEFIQSIIDIIKNHCEDIKIVKPNSKGSEMLGTKTFLVEKNKKRIICYPIERKVLYCIAKIGKKEKIIKDKYAIINKTLTDLINVGSCISTVEPMRDFNGYSWTTLPEEIESIYHNLVYQNIRILVGEPFLNHWIKNSESIIDYMENFRDKLEGQYGEKLGQEVFDTLSEISVVLAFRYNPKLKSVLQKEKLNVERKLQMLANNGQFVQGMTQEKRKLTEEIKRMDETLNNKDLLQAEYEKRNELLPLQEKIFSSRILSQMMAKEREEKLKKLEKVNRLLNPQNFLAFKKELEDKEKYLKVLNQENLDAKIEELVQEFQEKFLKCYQAKIKKAETKQEVMKLIYEFRYYNLLPTKEGEPIYEKQEIEEQRKEVERLLLDKAHELKLIDIFSKEKEIDYAILKNLFRVRVINLENLSIKVTKEKENNSIQLFDGEAFEEKMPIERLDDKKEMRFKVNKKIKVFNW